MGDSGKVRFYELDHDESKMPLLKTHSHTSNRLAMEPGTRDEYGAREPPQGDVLVHQDIGCTLRGELSGSDEEHVGPTLRCQNTAPVPGLIVANSFANGRKCLTDLFPNFPEYKTPTLSYETHPNDLKFG